MNVLVDTSVWSLALRRKAQDLNPFETALVDELTELIKEGRIELLGLIRQELLSGIRTGGQFEKLRLKLRDFTDLHVETSDFESAAKSSNELRSKGMAVSVVDVLICAVAIKRGLLIFTTDPDFQRYARVLPLRLHKPRRHMT